MSLTFVDGKTTLTCTCCKAKQEVQAKDDISERRYDHVHELMLASARTQGYIAGHICRACAKAKGIRFDLVDEIAKKHLTRAYFEARRNVRVIRDGGD